MTDLAQKVANNEDLLKELLAQQNIAQANRQQLGAMLQNITKRLNTLALPASTTSPIQPTSSATSAGLIQEPEPRVSSLYDVILSHVGVSSFIVN